MGLIDQAKANEADHTKGGEGGDFIAPAGLTMARFIGYVEVGKRKQNPWKGTAKPDCSEARFTFELLSPKNIREIEVDGETITRTDVINSKVAMKTGDKASFVKLLRKMAYGRDGIVNHAQMLGEAFLINVIHAEGKDREGNPRTYANMKDADYNWTISAPVQTDALTGKVANLPVPEPTLPLRLLLWDQPTTEQWQSVFIDGERTTKDKEGVETTESNNWLQRDIVTEAMNFSGSPLEQMLNGVDDLELPGDVADEPTKVEADLEAQATEDKAAEVGLEGDIKGKTADVIVVDDVGMLDDAAEQLAAAKAIIAKLTGG